MKEDVKLDKKEKAPGSTIYYCNILFLGLMILLLYERSKLQRFKWFEVLWVHH